jgi:hypothetical protein
LIAVDSSSWIAFFGGQPGNDTELVDRALADHLVVLPPVVLTELLSDPGLSPGLARLLHDLPPLEVHSGYWQRAGRLRAGLLRKRLKARLADVLIAQSCLDHRVPLVTRDRDFRHFAELAGLQLLG